MNSIKYSTHNCGVKSISSNIRFEFVTQQSLLNVKWNVIYLLLHIPVVLYYIEIFKGPLYTNGHNENRLRITQVYTQHEIFSWKKKNYFHLFLLSADNTGGHQPNQIHKIIFLSLSLSRLFWIVCVYIHRERERIRGGKNKSGSISRERC